MSARRPRPWVKYAKRGVPSSIVAQEPGRVNRIRLMFESSVRGVAKSFGLESLGINLGWLLTARQHAEEAERAARKAALVRQR